MEWQFIVALLVLMPIILLPAALVWYLNIGGAYKAMQKASEPKIATGLFAARRKAGARAVAPEVKATGGAGMAPGGGRRSIVVPIVLAFVPPALIWLLIGAAEWQMALALTLAIPLMLLGGALVWYLNASGLYKVLRETRRRQRTRAAVREAEAIVQGKPGYIAARRATEETPARAKNPAAAGGTIKLILPVLLALVPPALIWLFLGKQWEIALAATLGLPVMLLGVAFIWYINASGLYLVLRQTRQRQKARAKLLPQAEAIVRTQVAASAGVRKG